MIPWNIAEALGYEPSDAKQRMNITTASGMERPPLVEVREVSALQKKATHVPCIVHDLPETSRVDGLLGLSYLRNFTISINFQKGILVLA